jgi:hypothetical protein
MDQLITYETVAEFLKKPPMLLPCPDFTKLHAIQKHMAQVLMQLVYPQSAIHRLSGLISLPVLYTLLEPNPFVAPEYLDDVAVYPQFALPAQIKTANAMFA